MTGAPEGVYAGRGVIGKQVQVLYDLVTVNRRVSPQNAIAKVRRRGDALTRKPGNLPIIGTGDFYPGHEELTVPNFTHPG